MENVKWKSGFRVPLWLVPVCWAGSVLLGSVFELFLVMQLGEKLNMSLTFTELAVKSAVVTAPVTVCTLAAVFLMNRYPRSMWKYAAGIVVLQFLFGYLSIFTTVVSGADLGMATMYTPGYVVEEVGFLLPILLYSAGGLIAHGIALFILQRRRRNVVPKDVIDQRNLD